MDWNGTKCFEGRVHNYCDDEFIISLEGQKSELMIKINTAGAAPSHLFITLTDQVPLIDHADSLTDKLIPLFNLEEDPGHHHQSFSNFQKIFESPVVILCLGGSGRY